MGPEAVKSASGNQYVMNIVNDHSSHPWTYCLKWKSNVLPTLQNWAHWVEAESNECIGIVCTDGGKLDSDAMELWCNTNGYTLQTTAPYTSTHNGCTKHMHLTVMNRMGTMCASMLKVPPNHWDEFALTAGYLSAHTPTWTLGKTPYEVWHSRKPDLLHLCEIRSHAFALILKHNPKIYEWSFKCILVSYSPNSKAYWLYYPQTHQLFEFFHVKFIEHKDDISHPLYPGHVIDLPSTDPTTVTPDGKPPVQLIPSSVPSAPKQTFIQDEESFNDNNSQFWTVTDNLIKVPVPPLDNPADVIPAPTATDDNGPCWSACAYAPSSKAMEIQGIKHLPCVAQAIAESCEVGCHLKEQCAQAKFDCRQQILDSQASLTNVTPSLPTASIIPADAVPDNSLCHLPTPNSDTDFIAFCEVYAIELASPLINTQNPDEPTFHEAMNPPDANKWTLSIQDELKSLKKMGVYHLIPHSDVPTGRKILCGKWVLLLKWDEHGNPVWHNAYFVIKGFEQVFSQDYVNTTSPTTHMESVCLLLNIAATKDWDIQQFDVKTAFL